MIDRLGHYFSFEMQVKTYGSQKSLEWEGEHFFY